MITQWSQRTVLTTDQRCKTQQVITNVNQYGCGPEVSTLRGPGDFTVSSDSLSNRMEVGIGGEDWKFLEMLSLSDWATGDPGIHRLEWLSHRGSVTLRREGQLLTDYSKFLKKNWSLPKRPWRTDSTYEVWPAQGLYCKNFTAVEGLP